MSEIFKSTADYETLPDPYTVPIECIDLSDSRLPNSGLQLKYYQRVREEDPVHYLKSSRYGPFWSLTRYEDVQYVALNPQIFSSDVKYGGTLILDDMNLGFMSQDDPVHAQQRRAVTPVMVPSNLENLAGRIRQRTKELLDGLPEGEVFNWVDVVSIELTTRMLAILLDFPFEERQLLPYWTEWSTNVEAGSDPTRAAERERIIIEMATRFHAMYEAKKKQAVQSDLISILATSEATANLSFEDFMGLMVLIIVGGNDTTRNSMTAMIQLMAAFPDKWQEVKKDSALMSNACQEVVRLQSPVQHQRRTVIQDTELNGKKLKKGDKVIFWYRSANRDESAFPNADEFDPNRPNVRRHVAFGHGVHRCFGARLGELQIGILMQEIFAQGIKINLEGPPVATDTCMINGYESQLVSITREK